MKKLVIVGAGGFAREVLTLVRDINAETQRWEVVGFADDRPELAGASVAGLPVVGSIDVLLRERTATHVVLGIGSPVVKRRLADRLGGSGLMMPPLVHPTVVRSDSVRVGDGCVICAGNILTCDITLGRFVTLNLACTVGHDAVLEDFCTVAPGVNISGNVRVGAGTDVGTGTATVQGCTIGEWSVIGAGATVASDLPANCTAVGVPAKPIKRREEGWHLE
jgi:sugar O-acyltransferase (sialic acid O-acetyltransferase NeuD family)